MSPTQTLRVVFSVSLTVAVLGWPTRDSASARQIPTTHNTLAELDAAPFLRLTDRLTFETVPLARGLSAIADLWVESDQTLYVLDTSRKQIRVYDGDGRLSRRIDATQMPHRGEFLQIAVARDTILVLDFFLGETTELRLNLFGTDGTYFATLPYTGPDLGHALLQRQLSGTPDGWVIRGRVDAFKYDRAVPPSDTPRFDTSFVASLDVNTMRLRRMFTYAHGPAYPVGLAGGLKPLLSFEPTVTVASNGNIYANTQNAYVIDIRTSDGDLQRRITGAVRRIPVTDVDLDEYLRDRIASLERRKGGEAEFMREVYLQHGRRVGRAEVRPVLGRMLVSHDKHLIVRRLDLDADPLAKQGPTVWDLLEPDGRIAGRIRIPSGVGIYAFSWPYLYVLEQRSSGGDLVRLRIEGH